MSDNSPCSRVFRDPAHFLALGFGSGCAPKAPGTFGTLAAIPLYLLAQPLPLWAYLLLTAAGFILGVWICDRVARDLGVHDHPAIVWDEVVGYFLTMIAAPPGWLWIIAGFAPRRRRYRLYPPEIRHLPRSISGAVYRARRSAARTPSPRYRHCQMILPWTGAGRRQLIGREEAFRAQQPKLS